MHWETGEGRLLSQGRTVLSSDQIVLQGERQRAAGRWTAYIAVPGGSHAFRRHAQTLLELTDGRRGWFTVVGHDGDLLRLRRIGAFR